MDSIEIQLLVLVLVALLASLVRIEPLRLLFLMATIPQQANPKLSYVPLAIAAQVHKAPLKRVHQASIQMMVIVNAMIVKSAMPALTQNLPV